MRYSQHQYTFIVNFCQISLLGYMSWGCQEFVVKKIHSYQISPPHSRCRHLHHNVYVLFQVPYFFLKQTFMHSIFFRGLVISKAFFSYQKEASRKGSGIENVGLDLYC